MMRNNLPKTLILLFVILLAGCDQDPFHQNSRKISDVYYLQRWEDGKTYYINKKNSDENGGGVINGVVQKIGWSSEYIVARRKATYQGDADGWMLIDTKKGSITGPLTDEAFSNEPQSKGLEILSPEDAWKKLN